ncbi:fibrobacter succinogenes major paralogous domain-containing protein [Bacteroides sp. Marseille-P3684]|uniref:fibrobacter succinogenes major paralogous domain-containing protein n=1 Tax=Bacteroides sp. Marseille-P3684 TaxID=2086579 RepID=UPI000D0AC6F7|nr:fibrobacter succinogenes major paralogous domain-containing protein [Bacteroides sp. Marseille-P3684]
MKQWLISLLAALVLVACSDDDNRLTVEPTAHGTVTDNQGNTYGWVRIGDQEWTTENARNGSRVWNVEYYVPDYGWYETISFDADTTDYFNEYGNLLSYEEALASAPEGWRLPTDDDWKKLERAMGMGGEVDRTGWRGSIASLLTRSDQGAELGLKLGGSVLYSSETYGVGCLLKYDGEAGYYWTSTVDESKPGGDGYRMVFFRKLVSGQEGVERQSGNNSNKYMSVRWVRDVR